MCQRPSMMKRGIAILAFFASTGLAMGAGRVFEPTQAGMVEIKLLPAGRLLVSQSDQSYFSKSNGLFMPLFRYIQRHGISMTAPVEAKIDPGKMYFWVAEDQVNRAKADWNGVKVVDVLERKVVSLGVKGAYNSSNYEQAKDKLLEWIAKRPEVIVKGEPYGVFWDGPMTPWFMKSFEIHVEVDASESL